MKRFAAVTLLVTLGAAVLVAWSVAAPAGRCARW